MANILDSIYRLVNNPVIQMRAAAAGRNRINAVGYGLEGYVKDLFADSFGITDEMALLHSHNQAFSYCGNQNNPSDILLLGGDAVETKKIESASSSLALNSSFPKSKLYCDDPMLTQASRACEVWREKDSKICLMQVSQTTRNRFVRSMS